MYKSKTTSSCLFSALISILVTHIFSPVTMEPNAAAAPLRAAAATPATAPTPGIRLKPGTLPTLCIIDFPFAKELCEILPSLYMFWYRFPLPVAGPNIRSLFCRSRTAPAVTMSVLSAVG